MDVIEGERDKRIHTSKRTPTQGEAMVTRRTRRKRPMKKKGRQTVE